jgi:hypothetical protein
MGWFKRDPAKRLRKEHARLLEEAHRLSTIDRAKSDACIAEAAKVEQQLVDLQNGAS